MCGALLLHTTGNGRGVRKCGERSLHTWRIWGFRRKCGALLLHAGYECPLGINVWSAGAPHGVSQGPCGALLLHAGRESGLRTACGKGWTRVCGMLLHTRLARGCAWRVSFAFESKRNVRIAVVAVALESSRFERFPHVTREPNRPWNRRKCKWPAKRAVTIRDCCA